MSLFCIFVFMEKEIIDLKATDEVTPIYRPYIITALIGIGAGYIISKKYNTNRVNTMLVSTLGVIGLFVLSDYIWWNYKVFKTNH